MLRKIIKTVVFLGVFLAAGIAAAQSSGGAPARKEFNDFSARARQGFDGFRQQARQSHDEFSARAREKAEKKGSSQQATAPSGSETTLLKIPAYSQTTGETYFLSPKAANVYAKKESLSGFVKVTVSDGEVYVLPEEKVSFPVWYASEKSRLSRFEKRPTSGEASAENLCPPNTPECEDLLVLWVKMGVGEQKIHNLLLGARENGFAETLKKDKSLCLGVCDGAVKAVERRQRKRLLGEDFNVGALEEFMWQGGFTAAGWLDTFKEFCQQGRAGKLSEEQIRQVKPFAKRTEKAWKKKELPVIRLANRDPWHILDDGTFMYALDCIKDL